MIHIYIYIYTRIPCAKTQLERVMSINPMVIVWEKFSKVSAPLYFLYRIVIELTFENFYLQHSH